MINQLLGSTTLPALEETLLFSQARHEVLAGNIANWSTPGYEVRDLSVPEFQRRLREALSLQNSYQRPSLRGLSRSEPGDALREVREQLKTIRYHDGSNVGLEQQVTELVKNQLLHNLAVNLLQNQFRMLQTAISGNISV
ncbi:MAG TPA: flagellar basal body rod protein FlgB [Planctomycetaceae bacterium]|nr:flagellar basal body rod protein FlgB [Planctomycetaceae bacterium]